MLDTVEVEFDLAHRPFGDVIEFPRSGNWCSAWVSLEGRFPWGKIKLRSTKGGKSIQLKGSPSNYLQGHNIFGSNDVLGLLEACTARALTEQAVQFDPSELRDALGSGRLSRVDLACSILLPSGVETRDVIRALQKGMLESHEHARAYSDETALLPRKYAPSIQFYDKAKLVKKARARRWKSDQFSGASYLLTRLDGVVRVEFRFRKRWLRDNGLLSVRQWTPARARALLDQWLERAFVSGGVSIRHLPLIYYDLEGADRDIFALWLAGFDLSLHRHRGTLSRYYRRFRKEHGIDLRCRPASFKAMEWELAGILRGSKRWLGFPRGARKRGLVALTKNMAS